MKNMYKKPKKSCPNCKGNGYTLIVAASNSYNKWYDKMRCDCTWRYTNEYKKYNEKVLKLKRKLLKTTNKKKRNVLKEEFKLLQEKGKKFYDNNAKFDEKFEYDKPF
jgi:excinuclease UvrABC ATPase subunit